MVHFWIDDVRIKKLAEDTLKRAFIGEFKKVHEKYSDRRAGDLFDFYAQYITHVHLEDKLDPRTIGRTITDTRVEDEETRPAKGEIVLFLPVSMREKFTDDEIIGIIAHEIGHLFNEFYYTTSYDVSIGDISPIETELGADRVAKLLGFEKEILALRAKIPLPEERPPVFNISIDDIHRRSELS